MSSTGERIKEERQRLKLNQEQFGTAGGVAKNTQSRYEINDRAPDSDYFQKLSAYGVDILYIITGMRNENVATTPIEQSYLRICRALPNNDARMAGNAALMGTLYSFGIQLGDYQILNDSFQIAAQKGKSYGKPDQN